MTFMQGVLIALCVGVMICACVLLAVRVRHFITAVRAERWPAATGRIVRSRILRWAGGWLCRPEVSYEYEVGDRRYHGHRISAASEIPVFINAQERVQRYAPGREVRVYYDPKRADRAVLERTGTMTINAYMAGLILVILAAMATLRAIIAV